MAYIDRLIEQLKEACMEEKKTITLGDILDLLGPDSTDITVYESDGAASLTGPADCTLWEALEDLPVGSIGVDVSTLDIWLEERP